MDCDLQSRSMFYSTGRRSLERLLLSGDMVVSPHLVWSRGKPNRCAKGVPCEMQFTSESRSYVVNLLAVMSMCMHPGPSPPGISPCQVKGHHSDRLGGPL